MCGRYAFFDTDNLALRFGATKIPANLRPTDNAAPGQQLPIVTKNSPTQVRLMKWGLIPAWAKDPRIGYRLINARAETVADKPAFRAAFRERRCLVPANGFYEWQKTETGKQPYYIHPPHGEIWALAGLYESWCDTEGKETLSFTIITTSANSKLKPIHERMPVILNRQDEAEWQDKSQPTVKLLTLLKPLADSAIGFEPAPAELLKRDDT